MERKTVSGVLFALLLTSMFTFAFNIQPAKAEPRTWYVDDDGGADFDTIQEAINHASDGDTVFVHSGIYHENVKIKKELNLVGERKETTVIDGDGNNEAIYVHWDANNVLISGFTIEDAWKGIMMLNDYSTVSENIIVDNWVGIRMTSSHHNIISGNKIVLNGQDGIYMRSSRDNKLRNNIFDKNNRCGMYSELSSNNVFMANTVSNHLIIGIILGQSFVNNTFYYNNFINNTQQVFISEPQFINIWDNGYPSGGNYWSDYEERYPEARELGDSGIWDTPYVINENNQDNNALMEPWTPLPRTIGELKTKTEELGYEGEIDNQGIVKSLIAKLKVAEKLVDKGKLDEAVMVLEDFIMQVQELSGIHIAVEAAAILIESAEYIQSHL